MCGIRCRECCSAFCSSVCLVVTTIIVVIDVILALCLPAVLPLYEKDPKHYFKADGKIKCHKDAVKVCPCLAKMKYLHPHNAGIKFGKFKKFTHDVYPEDIKYPPIKAVVRSMAVLLRDPEEGKAFPYDEILVGRSRRVELLTDQLGNLVNYRYLVALTKPAYLDDEQQIFICNGIIIGKNKVLTERNCIKKSHNNLTNITVRSNSTFWSYSGSEHKVTRMKTLNNDLVEVRIRPNFDPFLHKRRVKYSSVSKWSHAGVAGWDDNMYYKNINQRHKYQPFKIKSWTTQNCNSTMGQICRNVSGDEIVSSMALINSCHELIAMKTINNDYKFIATNKNFQGKCVKIFERTCVVPDVDVCYK